MEVDPEQLKHRSKRKETSTR